MSSSAILASQLFGGGGIGRSLVSLIEDKALDLGLTKVRLKVLHDNTRAIFLYIKCKYKQIDQDSKYLYMEKCL